MPSAAPSGLASCRFDDECKPETLRAVQNFILIFPLFPYLFSPHHYLSKLRQIVIFPRTVDVRFELFNDYRLPRGVLPKWDLIQIGAPDNPNAIVGGQRFSPGLA